MSELGKYELPNGWAWATIPDLSGRAGIFNDGDWVESKDQNPDGDVRLIQLADVGDGVYRNKSHRFMTKAKADELRCTFLLDGDVLIARMPEPLGRACVFPGDAKPSVTVVDVAIVRSGNGEFDHRWLACFVNAHPFRSAISGLQAGSTRKRISRKNLATIPLPVPPLHEQRRIVAEIEKQFTRLEAGVVALGRLQANLKRYRAAVLKAACEGHLVPTEAELQKSEGKRQKETSRRHNSYETGADLLKRILTERRQNWQGRGKYKEPAAPDTRKLPSLPEGWTWATFDQITSLITKGSSPNWQGFDYCDDGIIFVRSENVRWGTLDLDGVAHLPAAFNAKERKSILRDGDVLLNLVGASIGRAAIATAEVDGGNVNQAVAVIRLLVKETMNEFAILWLNSSDAQKRIHAEKVEVARANFSLEDTRVLPLPLPPLAEQTRIVAEVERRLSLVDELGSVVSANLQRATRLRQSLLQRAFTGDLAAQNPDDEPAEVLLKRLKDLPGEAKAAKKKINPKGQNIMPAKPVTTLEELLQRLDAIGGAGAPDRLLLATDLGDEVEKFFDLLREGRNNGKLIVPMGTTGEIKRNRHEN